MKYGVDSFGIKRNFQNPEFVQFLKLTEPQKGTM